jgi:hypothetical protein
MLELPWAFLARCKCEYAIPEFNARAEFHYSPLIGSSSSAMTAKAVCRQWRWLHVYQIDQGSPCAALEHYREGESLFRASEAGEEEAPFARSCSRPCGPRELLLGAVRRQVRMWPSDPYATLRRPVPNGPAPAWWFSIWRPCPAQLAALIFDDASAGRRPEEPLATPRWWEARRNARFTDEAGRAVAILPGCRPAVLFDERPR